MTTNNEAFEVWFINELTTRHNCDEVTAKIYLKKDDLGVYRHSNTFLRFEGWQAATTEANKRIAAIESEVAMLNSALEISNKVMELAKNEITELQASNNGLREAIIKIEFEYDYTLDSDMTNAVTEGVKLARATPAESLQAHDNKVLERAAKVAMDMPSKADEIHEYRYSDDCKAMAWDISHAIRALKEVK